MIIDKRNCEGYLDPTCHEALTNIEKERKTHATETQSDRDRRCWECTRCNRCENAFKMTTYCMRSNQRKRRVKKNA